MSPDPVQNGGATRFRRGIDVLNIGLKAACGGTVTAFYICRAVVSGLVASIEYVGWRTYVSKMDGTWAEAVAAFVVGAIASLPGSDLVATTVVSSMRYEMNGKKFYK